MGGGPITPDHHSCEPGPLLMRPATKADLDAITRVAQAGFPDDPGCNYKYPYRYEHPHDFWKWTRLQYEEYIDQPEKYAVLVVTTLFADDGTSSTNPSRLASGTSL